MKYLVASISAMAFLGACTPAQQQTNQIWAVGGQQVPGAIANSPLASAPNVALPEMGVVNVLVDRFGINSEQAMGGVGSVFALAQQRMNPEDFMQLSASVPGIDQYLSAVPESSSTNVLWGAAGANMLGGQESGLGNLVGLVGSFQSLGMNANMISEFVPVVLQYIQGQSGPAVMSLLQNALY